MTSEGRPRVAAGHGQKNDAVRGRAILALLSESSIGAAAKRSGIGERTLRRWMVEDQGFRQELGTARRAAFEGGLVRIQALAAEAVETLQELLRSKKHPSVRLGAARTILELAVDRHDADTLLKRLEELEDLNKNSFPKR